MSARDTIAQMVKAGSLSLDQVHCIEQRVEKVANVQLAPEALAAIERLIQQGTRSGGSHPLKFVQAMTGRNALPTMAAIGAGGAALTAGGIGAAMAGSMGVHGVDRFVQAVKKGKDYKDMMEANPELARYDDGELQAAFNTLHKFNPELAGDPLVAGTFVRRVADADAIDHRTVGELARTRKEMGRPFGQQAAQGGASFNAAMGLLK
jgi:hypothetical protein